MKTALGAVGAFLLSIALPVAAFAQSSAEVAPAEKYRVRAEWRWWTPSVSGTIQKGFGSVSGTPLSLTDNLGITNESTWMLDGAIRLSKSFKLTGGYIPLNYSGAQAATTNFIYGDQLFVKDEEIQTSLKAQVFSGAIEWDFYKGKGGYAGAFFGADVLLTDSVLVAPATGQRVIDSATLPVPILGVVGRGYMGRHFSLSALLAGFTLGDQGHIFEMDLAARLHISDRFAAAVGYYRLSFEGTDGRDFVSLTLGGLSFGAEVSF
jgi:hypothetical protein